MNAQVSLIDYIPLVLTLAMIPLAIIIGIRVAISIIRLVRDSFKEPPRKEGIERVKIDRRKAAIFAVGHSAFMLFSLGAVWFATTGIANKLGQNTPLPLVFTGGVFLCYIMFQNLLIGCAIQLENEWQKRFLQQKEGLLEQNH